MGPWLGPALIAAIVSGLVSVLGWFATFYMGLRRDRMLRDEKVHDFQIALYAEVSSDVLAISLSDRKRYLAEAQRRYRQEPGYSVVVPRLARNAVYDTLLREIQILPSEVIQPLIDYQRQREAVEQFVEDLRDQTFRSLPAARQLLMYSDYLDMLGLLEDLARDAMAALADSLNIPVEDRPNLPSASAADEVSAGRQEDES